MGHRAQLDGMQGLGREENSPLSMGVNSNCLSKSLFCAADQCKAWPDCLHRQLMYLFNASSYLLMQFCNNWNKCLISCQEAVAWAELD